LKRHLCTPMAATCAVSMACADNLSDSRRLM
jgi:hypothetical protein